MNPQLKEKLVKLKLVAMDFDGVLTDGKVYVDQDGREMVVNSRRDSLGLRMLQNNGMEVVVISKETNPVVSKRCEKLKITCWQGIEDSDGKGDILKRIMGEKGLSPEQVLFVGDDVNDLAPLEYAGVGATVADGHPILKEKADIVLTRNGGDHAVRELCEMILEAKGKDVAF